MEDKIKAFIEDILEEEDQLFLVDYIKKGMDSQSKILVLLDGDQGVTIDQCASISRRTSHYIDEEIDNEVPFRLEVSSAGLDHPLKHHRQYVKNIEKNIKVWLLDGEILEGVLKSVHADYILLEKLEKKIKSEIDIKFSQIDKTLVLVSFK